eukprot:GHVR01177398.1.p2 GENE.GHVR01177398.1~~GHVR01177398.1.p2  ORF type:complete len:101 (-),score=11.97 GHVR01177398.1:52-354(-)
MVSQTNLSNERLTVGIRRVIAILDEAAMATEEIEPGPAPVDGPEPEIAMPGYLEELYGRSTESLKDGNNKQEVRDLLNRFQDVFVGPGQRILARAGGGRR